MPTMADDNGRLMQNAMEQGAREAFRAFLRWLSERRQVRDTIQELKERFGEDYTFTVAGTPAAASVVAAACRKEGLPNVQQVGKFVVHRKADKEAVENIGKTAGVESYTSDDPDRDLSDNTEGKKLAAEALRCDPSQADSLTFRSAEEARLVREQLNREEIRAEVLASDPSKLAVYSDDAQDIKDVCCALGAKTVFPSIEIENSRELPATHRQTAALARAVTEGKIDRAEVERLGDHPTRGQVRDFMNEHSDVFGRIGDRERKGQQSQEAIDADAKLTGDKMAAMRREDIGNVETTADYVQSQPNSTHTDQSQPFADGAVAPGSGDRDADGVRDSAEDRDGDGTPDDREYEFVQPQAEEPDMDDIEPNAQVASAERAALLRDPSIGLQQETR